MIGVFSVAVVVTLILACGASATAGAGGEARLLRSGRMGNYIWASFIEQPESKEEREAGSICLAISMLEPTGGNHAEGNEVATCQRPPSDRPLVEHIVGGREGKVRTVIAILFPQDVRTVRLKVRGEPGRTVHAQIVGLPSSFNVAERRVPYVVRGFTRKVCIESIRGFDAAGVDVTSLGRLRCG